MKIDFLDKFKGTLFGVAIGDTLGRPFEGKLREDIQNQFEYFEDFLWKNKKLFSTYTDDTQLTLHLAKALIKGNGFNRDKIINEFIRWIDDPPINPGYGSLTSIKKLKYGFSWKKAASNSGGNGTIMRISPIALLYSKNLNKLIKASEASSLLTHSHPAATAGARIIARAIAYLVHKKSLSKIKVKSLFKDLKMTISNSQNQIWNEFCETLSILEENLALLIEPGLIKFSQVGVKTPYFIEEYLGKAFVHPYAMSTSICTLFLFLKNYKSFEDCIFELATCGGDTNTVGSIGGALLGAYYGYKKIPGELISFVKNPKEILNTADHLYEVFQKLYG